MSTSGVYSCHEDSDNVVWEFEHFNSTDCTGNSLKVYKYEYPKGCNVGDKIDSKYVFQAGCGTKTTSAPYNDIKTGGYLLGSAITDASCDAGDEFYYSWVKTNTCLKGKLKFYVNDSVLQGFIIELYLYRKSSLLMTLTIMTITTCEFRSR